MQEFKEKVMGTWDWGVAMEVVRYGQIFKEHANRSDGILLTNWILNINESVELRKASRILGLATRETALLCAETRCHKGGIGLTGLWGDVALRCQ